MPDPLADYHGKRRFDATPEPKGTTKRKKAKFPIFVIQKHAATRLHYDFRLEVDGVLKSWAITKEPSLDPSVKRLAVRTEDHPRDYAEFEGLIPRGEYGGGPVIVWDYGVFVNQTTKHGEDVPIARAVEHGHVTVLLQGVKLAGLFALTRFKVENGKAFWLFSKVADDKATTKTPAWDAKSVLTGATVEDVREGRTKGRVWRSNRAKNAPPDV